MLKSVTILLLAVLLSGCYAFRNDSDNPTVTVSIPPYMWFVKQIAGQSLNVNSMMMLTANPATYAPTMRQMQMLEKSDLYIKTGYLGFELNWMDNFKGVNANMKVADASEGIDFIAGTCSHDEPEGHHHGVDPHVWVSPKTAQKVLTNIYHILVENYPKDSAYYRENYQRLILTMQELDGMMIDMVSSSKRKSFIIYHPAMSYVARDYGLQQLQIEADGKSPSISHIKEMVDIARHEGITHILAQKQFDKTAPETIAKELEGNVIVIDPLAEKWSHQTLKLINVYSRILN